MEKLPLLYTERLELRDITTTDPEEILAGLSHHKVTRYYGVALKNQLDAKRQMLWYKQLKVTKEGYWMALYRRSSSRFIGGLGLHNWSEEHRMAELGFWLFPAYWGKGYMKEAIKHLLFYLQQRQEILQLYAMVDERNKASECLLRSLGFQLIQRGSQDTDRLGKPCTTLRFRHLLGKDVQEGGAA